MGSMGDASIEKNIDRMISVGSLCGFAMRAVILFAIFVWGWSLCGTGYATLFRATGNAMFADSPGKIVSFSPAPASPSRRDTELVVVDLALRSKSTTALSSRRHGYLPMALFLSLILATPIAWRRRAFAAVIGFVLVGTYIAIKLILLPAAYGPEQALSASQNAEAGSSILSKFFWVVSASSVGWAIIPASIWLLLVFRQWGLTVHGKGSSV